MSRPHYIDDALGTRLYNLVWACLPSWAEVQGFGPTGKHERTFRVAARHQLKKKTATSEVTVNTVLHAADNDRLESLADDMAREIEAKLKKA